ncbi:MAG: hypothetical protein R2834_03720 [Rhodothermales bacterium]
MQGLWILTGMMVGVGAYLLASPHSFRQFFVFLLIGTIGALTGGFVSAAVDPGSVTDVRLISSFCAMISAMIFLFGYAELEVPTGT